MSLWGRMERLDIIGTVRATNGSTTLLGATGANMIPGTTGPSEFLTQIRPGNVISFAGSGATGVFEVRSIESNTSLTLSRPVTGATGVWVAGAFSSQKPEYLTETERLSVFGVDTNEVRFRRVAHGGWVRVTRGTGGRAGRVKRETLVAFSATPAEMGDAENVEFPNA